jgi:hypothetical protein
MIQKQKINPNEGNRQHRITTYLSATEFQDLQTALEESHFTNLSQFNRYQILNSINKQQQYVINVPEVNYQLSQDFIQCVTSFNRLVSMLELDADDYEQQAETEKLAKLTSVIGYVKEVAEAVWHFTHFIKGNIEYRDVLKNMAYLTLSSDELLEIASTLLIEEGA